MKENTFVKCCFLVNCIYYPTIGKNKKKKEISKNEKKANLGDYYFLIKNAIRELFINICFHLVNNFRVRTCTYIYRVRCFIILIVPVELCFLFFHFYDIFLSFKPETLRVSYLFGSSSPFSYYFRFSKFSFIT